MAATGGKEELAEIGGQFPGTEGLNQGLALFGDLMLFGPWVASCAMIKKNIKQKRTYA